MSLTRRIQLLAILGVAQPVWAQSLSEPDVPTALYERKGEKIVNASANDFAVAKTYHTFQNKGAVKDGQRVSILTAKLKYKVGEPVRVLHVLESIKPGVEVYVMGPKPITDEYVDGRLATPKRSGFGAYDGAVISRPIADFNYDITSYTFTSAGIHTIHWKGHGGLGDENLPLESNTITLEVSE